jgi:uncharacterized protein (DUF1697 family)
MLLCVVILKKSGKGLENGRWSVEEYRMDCFLDIINVLYSTVTKFSQPLFYTMHTYISLLRGINVSGQKKILMKDLIILYETLEFTHIATYLQSGNVVFQCAETDQSAIATKIEQKIFENYGFEVPVLIKDAEAMKKILQKNPFGEATEQLYVTFLYDIANQIKLQKIQFDAYLPDKYEIIDNAIYISCPNGYGNTKLSNHFFETKLKVTATTRNWKTVNQLAMMAEKMDV